MTTSSLAGLGFGCEASSRSFAESLAVRALSTGSKTLLLSFELFAFFVLALAPFAMATDMKLLLRRRECCRCFGCFGCFDTNYGGPQMTFLQ
jgi:hypothetical protein